MTYSSQHAGVSDDAVARVVRVAAETVPSFRDRLLKCNLTLSELTSVEDLKRLPILTKDDLLEAQAQDPPFGGLVAAGAKMRRVFQSPGPIYEPQMAVPDHWGAAPALRAAGFTANDLVLNCFGYHLTPAGALFEDASLAVGAAVIPGGTGSKDLQARAIADLGVSAYTGTPSYLKALVDAYDDMGLGADNWRIERALVSAEPLPESLRQELSQRVATVHMAYGTAQTGILAYEEAPGDGLTLRSDALIQLCDLATGEPITEGRGQIVVTLLRSEYPLVRFGTGDISAWAPGGSGRDRRLVGILGGVGQGVKVRGMFLHPAQVQEVLGNVSGLRAFRMVVERHNHRDHLRCEVQLDRASDSRDLTAQLGERIRSGLRFDVEVVEVDELAPGGPVIDDRRTWD